MKINTSIQILFLAFAFSCSEQVEESEVEETLSNFQLEFLLRERANDFMNALSKVEQSEAVYTTNIKPFFDPEISNMDSLCGAYYYHWRGNFEQNNYSIHSNINSINLIDKKNATVLIDDHWHLAEGDTVQYQTEISWVFKNDTWYRTINPRKEI